MNTLKTHAQRPKNQLLKHSSTDAYQNHAHLLKYFPKYYSTLNAHYSTFRKGPSLRKLKCVKKIDSLTLRFMPPAKKYLALQLLQNKRRSLRKCQEISPFIVNYFPNLHVLTFNLDDRRAWRGFLSICNLKALRLQYGVFTRKNVKVKRLESRFWAHLAKIRSLEHLNLNIARNLDENMHGFMNQLNSSVAFLDSLKTLQLQFSLSREHKIYRESWNFKNLAKKATDLEIFDETALSLGSFLTDIDTFTNLKDLKVEILRTTFQDNYAPLDFSPFRGLGNLNKLKSLFLAISLDSPKCLPNLLKNIVLPTSLTDVNIEMTSVKWGSLIKDIESVSWKERNPFEENSICIEFYDKWAEMKNVTGLTLSFSDIDGYFIPGAYFIAPLLKKLSNLTFLDYSSFYGLEPGSKKCLHMSYFWHIIDHLKSTLKTLIVNDFAISIKDFHPNDNEAPNLASVSLSGFMLGETNIGSIMKMLKGHTKDDNSTYDLHVGQVIINDNKSWSLFLNDLRKSARRNLSVDLDIDIRKLDVAVLLEDLVAFVREGRRVQGVYLFINNLPRPEDKILQDLKAALKENPVFEAVQIRTRDGIVLLDFQKEEKKLSYKKDMMRLMDEVRYEPVEQFEADEMIDMGDANDMNVVWEDEEEGNMEAGDDLLGNFFGEEDFREIEEDF